MEGTDEQAGDDWLAGATIEADSQEIEVGQVQIALNDLNLPHPDEWGGDSGTALA
jgi:hypothetical protein